MGHVVTGSFEARARYLRADDPTILLMEMISTGTFLLKLN